MLIHGTNELVTKGFFYLKNGPLTLKFLPRISPGDATYGITYSERTKAISTWFKQEYRSLRQEVETPAYYSRKMFSNFLYKGPVLEWYMRIKVQLEGYYTRFERLIPRNSTIVDMGCGYG